jgi:hypothetical protein
VKEAADAVLRPEQVAYLEGIGPARDPLLSEMKRVEALRKFNRSIVSDARLRGVVLPLGDGVA